MAKRKIDVGALDFGKVESASGISVRQIVTVKQGVESVEELFLGPFLLGKQLYVVYEQRIDRAIVALKVCNSV